MQHIFIRTIITLIKIFKMVTLDSLAPHSLASKEAVGWEKMYDCLKCCLEVCQATGREKLVAFLNVMALKCSLQLNS